MLGANSQCIQQPSTPPLPWFQVNMEGDRMVELTQRPLKLLCLEPWLYCFIIFPSSRKQMGWPDYDFYLLFLSKVPQGFLLLPRDRPQIYSAGEKQATSADLMLKALVCLNVLFFAIYASSNFREMLAYPFLSQWGYMEEDVLVELPLRIYMP